MNLINKSFSQILCIARDLGLKASKEHIEPGTNVFSDVEAYANSLYQNEQEITPNDQNIREEKANLRRLLTLMIAWQYRSSFIEEKFRNHIKYKAELDKRDRRLVNTGLAILCYFLCARSNDQMKTISLLSEIKSNIILNDDDYMFMLALSKADIIKIVYDQIEKINEFENEQYKSTSYIHENFNGIAEAGQAIEGFVVTTRKKKVAQVLSILIGLISASASAAVLSTGVIAMLGSGPLGLSLAVMTLIFTFYANAKFLNKAMPDFILKLMRQGSITEYVDKEGNRRQLSFFKKFVTVPLTLLGSLSISVLTTTFTIKSLTFLLMHFVPAMIAVPYLIPAIAITGAVCLGISTFVVCAAASVKTIKSYEQSKGLKEWFQSLKDLSLAEKFKLAFKAIILPICIFSLGFLEYLHAFRVIPVLGIAGAAVAGVFCFIGRFSFITQGLQKLTSAISNRFNTRGSFLEKVFYYSSLLWQSVVSGALIWSQPHSGASVAAIGGSVNSFGSIMNKESKHPYMRVVMEDKMSERIGLRDYSAFTAKANRDKQDTSVNKYWWDSYSNETISLNQEEAIPMVNYGPSSSRLFLIPAENNSGSYSDAPTFSRS